MAFHLPTRQGSTRPTIEMTNKMVQAIGWIPAQSMSSSNEKKPPALLTTPWWGEFMGLWTRLIPPLQARTNAVRQGKTHHDISLVPSCHPNHSLRPFRRERVGPCRVNFSHRRHLSLTLASNPKNILVCSINCHTSKAGTHSNFTPAPTYT